MIFSQKWSHANTLPFELRSLEVKSDVYLKLIFCSYVQKHHADFFLQQTVEKQICSQDHGDFIERNEVVQEPTLRENIPALVRGCASQPASHNVFVYLLRAIWEKHNKSVDRHPTVCVQKQPWSMQDKHCTLLFSLMKNREAFQLHSHTHLIQLVIQKNIQ